jgi:predicted MPP superfamily phosphohydrolase
MKIRCGHFQGNVRAPGPLYVNPGLGWFPAPIRFNCPSEITVFEL